MKRSMYFCLRKYAQFKALMIASVILLCSLPIYFSNGRNCTILKAPMSEESSDLSSQLLTEMTRHSPLTPTQEVATSGSSTKHGTPNTCYDKETMTSSVINKLGEYPQHKRYVTIGISSVRRPSGKNYLVKTVKHLLDNFNEDERKQIFIVIFLADFDEAPKYKAMAALSDQFQKYVDQDILHVIFAPQDYYPPLANMKTKYGDSQPRIFWRSKLVVDFSFLMCYCRDLSEYYLHLEDDVVPTPSLFPKLRDFIASQKKPWAMLDAAFMGHVAKVYHSADLENIATFFYLLYDEMPVDWLIISWRRIKYGDHYILPPASLFQHIGDNSSFLENKLSYKSKEKYFDQYDIKYRGLNPPASVSSSMIGFSETKPENAYNNGTGYFWVKEVKKDDYILITFAPATSAREVFVDTGSLIAYEDQLKSGVLQASYQTNEGTTGHCIDFETIGDFKTGKVKVSLTSERKLLCLRILVTDSQDKWLFLREVDVF
ncbi:alpha-1,3-mannosyl-glycoprotein 4-beta-N-acetylglucosaminyltransferase C-like [Montipora foliosa]|uniref:alpha-1,3-mannosyl-glycoprotein 4-beta-N-acetylglucosaminyltransferase C-like n=1 Tax=Montipora foliosa TaxID=591990 RepID=UPI0035F1E56F